MKLRKLNVAQAELDLQKALQDLAAAHMVAPLVALIQERLEEIGAD